MKEYLHWSEITVPEDTDLITERYNQGYLFTRLGKGTMHQTRSVRIDLNKFQLSSENKRILKKGYNIRLESSHVPYPHYSWEIGKMAKDFYDKKSGGAFSANKIKELITTKHNFNTLLLFLPEDTLDKENIKDKISSGYAICYKDDTLVHYCYPFYDINKAPKDMGMIMIINSIIFAKDSNLKYIYLGSLQRPNDTYKLQFSGIEWFDGTVWKNDLEEIKNILAR